MHTHIVRLLESKFMTPQILGSAEISTGLGVFLKILSYRIFWKKIFRAVFFDFFPKCVKKQRSIFWHEMAEIIKIC